MKLSHVLLPNKNLREILIKKLNTARSLYFYGISELFSEVEVETITECNLRCKYCPNSIYERGLPKNRKLLPVSIFQKIVDELSLIKTRIVRFSPHMYGEPLLDERLPDLMQYAHKKLPKTNLSIFTNGVCLTTELYKKLRTAGVQEFVITQHTPHMLENIREIISYNDNEKNRLNIIYRGRLNENQLGNRGGLVNTNNAPLHKPCITPSKRLVIDYKGNVLLCCDDYFGKHVFGNVANESVLEIWKKPEFAKIRKELRNKIWRLDMCRSCRGAS